MWQSFTKNFMIAHSSEPSEKRPRKGDMADTATVGASSESPPRKPSPSPEEISALKDHLHTDLEPLLDKDRALKKELAEKQKEIASLRKELKKTSDSDDRNDLQEQIYIGVKLVENLKLSVEVSESSISNVQAKYMPKIRDLELQVQDKVRAGLRPEAVPKYDAISKRLKAIAEVLEAKDLNKCFRSLCGNKDLLDLCYTKSYKIFEPVESPVADTAFDEFRQMLNRFLERMPVSSYDREAKRSFLSLPFFLCALRGLDDKFTLDLEVNIEDKYSKLNGDADIVLFCGKVEIIVIEEKRGGTSSKDKTESGIPQALVEMDCLSKNRLTVQDEDLQLDNDFCFGIVTDCIHWHFLKLHVDGTYYVSERYDLPADVCGEKCTTAQLSLLRGICSRIRGMVVEASKLTGC